jgi:hypothetical protein
MKKAFIGREYKPETEHHTRTTPVIAVYVFECCYAGVDAEMEPLCDPWIVRLGSWTSQLSSMPSFIRQEFWSRQLCSCDESMTNMVFTSPINVGKLVAFSTLPTSDCESVSRNRPSRPAYDLLMDLTICHL